MNLVIDANIFISALIATQGKTFDLIFNGKITLYTPQFLFEEIEKHKQDIIRKAGVSESDVEMVLSLITSKIMIVQKQDFKAFIRKAATITPDPDDTEYFALALKLKCPIWSNEKRLKNQEEIQVYSTAELIRLFLT